MNNPIKQTLLNIIDFIRYKVETDSCTPEEMKSVYKFVSEHTVSKATTTDIAEFYNQSPSNVRNVLSRYGINGESKRFYDFAKLQKVMPKSWRKAKPKHNEDYSYGTTASDNYATAAEQDMPYGNE